MSLGRILAKKASHDDLMEALIELEAENNRYREAVKWALGQNGDFATQPDRDEYHGPERKYWWRAELRERAGLGD